MKLHTTIGVYPNGDSVVNGVLPEHLDEHVEYNRSHRPGRALVVDGVTVLPGIGVGTLAIAKAIARHVPQQRATIPYR